VWKIGTIFSGMVRPRPNLTQLRTIIAHIIGQ
jgi:hypothetical protein